MLIGNKNSFAIEFDIDELHGGAWLFGKMCYWVGGRALGDYESGTSLRDVLFQMKYLVEYCGRRESCLCDATGPEIFNFVDSSIYGGAERINEALRFDISIPVDTFNGFKIFLIDCHDGISRVIYREGDGRVNETRIVVGEFDSVIKRFYVELEHLYESTR